MSIADAPVIAPLNPPRRILLGPGPSPVDDRVLRSMAAPLIGHLDPLFVRTMNEVQELLHYVLETNNGLTMPASGTGSAGMEAAVANLLEPGEEIVICINGYFGERMREMALHIGAHLVGIGRNRTYAATGGQASIRRVLLVTCPRTTNTYKRGNYPNQSKNHFQHSSTACGTKTLRP